MLLPTLEARPATKQRMPSLVGGIFRITIRHCEERGNYVIQASDAYVANCSELSVKNKVASAAGRNCALLYQQCFLDFAR